MRREPDTLGLGVSWRPELALAIERRSDLGFVELIAEDFDPRRLPEPIRRLMDRGVRVVPHGIGLSLGGAEVPDPKRLHFLADLGREVGAPLVSEHLCFVRAGGLESGHLLALPRTEEALGVVVENVRAARQAMPVPLALENVASLLDWPGAEMDEPTFLRRVVEEANVGLLLDVENVYANCRNAGSDPLAFLDRLPLERIAYVHVAGGVERDGLYHDTHTAPVPRGVLELLEEVCARVAVPGVTLERDGLFPSEDEFHAELDAIATAVARGDARRQAA
jgi:uncharacterized protein (UPF0276 family)